MSDPEKPGAPEQAPDGLPASAPTPGASAPVAATPPAAEPTPGSPAEAAGKAGAFGSTRGSGLARGKRTAHGAAPATAAPGPYKPTAVEVIKPVTEYKNPFTGETTVSAPPVNEPPAPVAAKPEAV